jgi:hypothetical protein
MLTTDAVRQVKFNRRDKWRRGQTIDEWVQDLKNPKSPANQLKTYWNSSDIKERRGKGEVVAYLAVIVGSRKILLSKLDENGELEQLRLVDDPRHSA